MLTNARGLKVVVADSDRTILELLQIRLDIAGYHACIARTGVAVLETLKHVRPGAMIIDAGLSEMSGFDVLQALIKRGEKLPCPTLVVGRKLSIEDIQLALSLGARDCMAKPFSGADVLERLARMLKTSKADPPRRKIYYVDAPRRVNAQP